MTAWLKYISLFFLLLVGGCLLANSNFTWNKRLKIDERQQKWEEWGWQSVTVLSDLFMEKRVEKRTSLACVFVKEVHNLSLRNFFGIPKTCSWQPLTEEMFWWVFWRMKLWIIKSVLLWLCCGMCYRELKKKCIRQSINITITCVVVLKHLKMSWNIFLVLLVTKRPPVISDCGEASPMLFCRSLLIVSLYLQIYWLRPFARTETFLHGKE